ncbi:MAG: Trk system potassium uptake protein TrkA [Methanonatronarchaeales archaeon]|nr:Trk system potassium uptake protein TrkA [Methanonatronarchaeales archaeon]
MRVVIAGAGRVGRSLADRLSSRGWGVNIIDRSPERCSEITRSDLDSYCGDAGDPATLKEAGAGSANLFFALTDDDEVNLGASEAALDLGAGRAIARCENVENQERFEGMGVRTVSPTDLAVDVLEDMFENPRVSSSLHVAGGEGEVMELSLSSESPVVGRRIGELPLEDVRVAALRDEERGFVIPGDDHVLEAGDVVVLVGRRGVTSSATHMFIGEEIAFPRGYGDALLVLLLNESSLDGALEEAFHIADIALLALNAFSLGGEELLRRADERAREWKLKLESLGVREGNLIEETEHEVSLTNPAMVVVDEEEMGVMDRILRRKGSAAQVVSSLPCPVLVSKREHTFERMLIPVDGSESYDRSAEMGVELASLLGSDVLAVSAVPPMRSTRKGAVERAEESLRSVERFGSLWNVPVETRVIEGNPVHNVTQLAGREDIGIAVLAHKREGDGLFKHEVSERLLEELPVSTLMIK